ncbi:hypothetical protein [Massilia sp. Root418]|uniref:hypothetical protein n=1 Tax=Massilia sp. Root418 TaxID=1736532 RepID=UPI00138F4604|nr:hypothetical protein [Massilia sp. Root418]
MAEPANTADAAKIDATYLFIFFLPFGVISAEKLRDVGTWGASYHMPLCRAGSRLRNKQLTSRPFCHRHRNGIRTAQTESGPQSTKMLFLRNVGRNNNVSLFHPNDMDEVRRRPRSAGPAPELRSSHGAHAKIVRLSADSG